MANFVKLANRVEQVENDKRAMVARVNQLELELTGFMSRVTQNFNLNDQQMGGLTHSLSYIETRVHDLHLWMQSELSGEGVEMEEDEQEDDRE